MTIFNSYVKLPEGTETGIPMKSMKHWDNFMGLQGDKHDKHDKPSAGAGFRNHPLCFVVVLWGFTIS
jgi:hypothetical protein